MKWPRQCAILVGGLGTRLGSLTAATPKPLLDCAGRPFLAWLMRELIRFGVEEFILLAGYNARSVEAFAKRIENELPKPVKVKVSVEPHPAGTGGAIFLARNLLDEQFILLNGDSWFDVNLARSLRCELGGNVGRVLLRHVEDASRYSVVDLVEGQIKAFYEKPETAVAGLINTGIYVFSRDLMQFLAPSCSLERDVLPLLAKRGLLSGYTMDGYFIDIGIPADYARAGKELPQRFQRPAVFFDRDGVLNEDLGWVGTKERLKWMPGAREAVQLVNERGWHAFVVTNQAGISRGLYDEDDLRALHAEIVEELNEFGATLDDWRFCPHHPEGVIERYKKDCSSRKPRPGMIISLLDAWQPDRSASFLVGDKQSDLEAAERAGVAGYHYDGHRALDDFVASIEWSSR